MPDFDVSKVGISYSIDSNFLQARQDRTCEAQQLHVQVRARLANVPVFEYELSFRHSRVC